MTIRLHTLGQSCIEVGTIRIGPESERLFALLLYLAVERGKQVSRTELRRLLWPEADATHSTHSLRQLIYRARRMGVALQTQSHRIALPSEHVEADFAPFVFSSTRNQEFSSLQTHIGCFLPGYAPSFSDQYESWVEMQRDSVHSGLRRALVMKILKSKSNGEWSLVEHLANCCLQLDPLNEEATLALAEAAAFAGNKNRALRIIDQYTQEIGSQGQDIRLPAAILRRRVSDAMVTCDVKIPNEPPLVGRVHELNRLNSFLEHATQGRGSAHHLRGERGIGKSRFLTEFTRSAILRGKRVVRVQLRQHDEHRPLAAFAEMAPKLLALPGALGSSPESLRHLRNLTSYDPALQLAQAYDPESNYACVRTALLDLVASICCENCLVLLLEDIDHLDKASAELLAQLIEYAADQRLLLVMSSKEPAAMHGTMLHPFGRVYDLNLRPLDRDESLLLLKHYTDQTSHRSESFWNWCEQKAGGNPYYLTELAQHGQAESGCYRLPDTLAALVATRLGSLRPLARRLLQSVAILGRHSTLERVEALLDHSTLDLLDSLDEAEMAGFIEIDATRVHLRTKLLGEVALQSASNATRQLLHRRAALILEREGTTVHPSGLIWECAEHWKCSGEESRALETLRACARYCMQLGMPGEASKILTCAIERDAGVTSLPLLHDWVAALQLEEDWIQVQQVAKRIATLSAAILPPPSSHTEHELTVIESDWHSGAESELLLDRLLVCVRSVNVPDHHVRRAAMQGLILACDGLQNDVATYLYQTIVRIDRRAPNLALTFYAEYVFNLSFGDLDAVTHCARRWIAHSRLSENPAALSRCLRNAATGLHHAGLTSEAIEACTEGYRIAVERRLRNAATGAAIRLAGLHCDIGDFDQAAAWLATASEGISVRSSNIFYWDYCCRMAEISLRQARHSEVLPWIERAHASQVIRSTYSRIESSALWCEYRVLVTQIVPSNEDMADLMTLFERVKCGPACELLVVAICRAMAARGERESGCELANRYVSHWRREKYPVSAQLRQFLKVRQPQLLS